MFGNIVQRIVGRKRFGLELAKLYICAAVLFVAYAYNFCASDPYMSFDCMCFAVGVAGMGFGGFAAVELAKKLLKK